MGGVFTFKLHPSHFTGCFLLCRQLFCVSVAGTYLWETLHLPLVIVLSWAGLIPHFLWGVQALFHL